MNCPKCESGNLEYLKPELWNKYENKDKNGGYHCLNCGNLFSFKEGVTQNELT